MPQYIILLYDDPKKFAEFSPQEMQEAFKKYYGWGQKMRAQGRLTGKEVLGGYYMFNADSYEHAIDLTRDHPQLEYGGTVEVREIQVLTPPSQNA